MSSHRRKLQLGSGTQRTHRAATVLPGKEGHAPGKYQLGNPVLESPAGSRVVSRGSAEQNALENQGGGSGTWMHREGKERMLTLAEVQVPRCRSA